MSLALNRQAIFYNSVALGATFLGMASINHFWAPFDSASFAVTSYFATVALLSMFVAVVASPSWGAERRDMEDLTALARASQVFVAPDEHEAFQERFVA